MPGNVKRVIRADYMPFPDEGPNGSWMVEKMQTTDEGFLTGRAIATNVGVFPYVMEDGSVLYELRDANEVFHPDSVASLKKVVLTNDHPDVMVNAENSKELSVGFTGDVRQDQFHLAPSITITDKDAIQDVMAGKKGLSCGYTADVVMESGNWMGINYDAVQKNIRYNHLAIVDRGRAGDAAKLKLDSVDSVGVQQIDNKQVKGSAIMPKFKIDNVDYEVDAAVHSYVKDKEKELATVKKDSENALSEKDKELATVQAKADQFEEKCDTLEKEITELKDNQVSQEKIDAAVKERVDLNTYAEKAGVEVKEDMSPTDIKKAIVIAVSPAAKDKLDSCDDTYIEVRYDGAKEALDDKVDPTLGQDSLKHNDSGTGKTPNGKPVEKGDSDNAYDRMVDRMKNGGAK
jgi:hypothetical protein